MLVLLVCPAAVVRATECDPQLGSQCWDSSHCTITSHEGDIKCYHMWRECLAILCDVWRRRRRRRSTGRGSGRYGVQHTTILDLSRCRKESLTSQATTLPTSHLFSVACLSRCPASYQPQHSSAPVHVTGSGWGCGEEPRAQRLD